MSVTVAVGAKLQHATYGPGTVTAVVGDEFQLAFDDPSIPTGRFLSTLAPVSLDGDELQTETFDARLFGQEVREETRKALLRSKVRDAIQAAREPAAEPFDLGTLAEILARPTEPPMRIEGLLPRDASMLIVAQRKTGKTTLVNCLARSLLTGEQFLGRFDVDPVEGRVALLNYEVSGPTVARWASDHGVPVDRFVIVNLRGRRNPLAHAEDRAKLAGILRALNVQSVIVDPFGRAYTGASQNDSGEVGSWLISLDRFVRSEVGARDLILTAHAGWNGERTRGASALEDWADVIVTMTKDAEDDSQRFLRAIGRDVDVDEDRLDYDMDTRALRMAGVGSRKKASDERKTSELAVFILRAAREQPGASVTALENLIKAMDEAPAFRNGDVSRAAKWAARQGLMRIDPGGRGRRSEHFALDPTSPNLSPTSPGETFGTSPTSPIGERFRGEYSAAEVLPEAEAAS